MKDLVSYFRTIFICFWYSTIENFLFVSRSVQKETPGVPLQETLTLMANGATVIMLVGLIWSCK